MDREYLQIRSAENGRLLIGELRRTQIVNVVRRLISQEGIDAVTIAKVASLLGTSRGVVNHHFSSKEEMMREALRAAVKDANTRAADAIRDVQNWRGLLAAVTGLASTDSDWWPIYVAFLARANASDGEFYREQIRQADQSYRDALLEATGSQERSAVVLALLKGLAMQRLVDPMLDVSGAIEEAGELLTSWRTQSPSWVVLKRPEDSRVASEQSPEPDPGQNVSS